MRHVTLISRRFERGVSTGVLNFQTTKSAGFCGALFARYALIATLWRIGSHTMSEGRKCPQQRGQTTSLDLPEAAPRGSGQCRCLRKVRPHATPMPIIPDVRFFLQPRRMHQFDHHFHFRFALAPSHSARVRSRLLIREISLTDGHQRIWKILETATNTPKPDSDHYS